MAAEMEPVQGTALRSGLYPVMEGIDKVAEHGLAADGGQRGLHALGFPDRVVRGLDGDQDRGRVFWGS